MSKIDYKSFIEDNFMITTTSGEIVPFVFNDIQSYYYDLLVNDYGEELQGVRENILKSRRFGFSSIIDAMFATDFILSELGAIPLTNSDVYSYKEKDTLVLFNRVNQFIDSYLLKDQGGDYAEMSHRKELKKLRKEFLKTDVNGTVIVGKNGAEYHCLTAGAKVSGRGGTKQNIHWSEVAFYNNTDILNARDLVTGAEEQVSSGIGKIFRETTGNVADDFFSEEYQEGIDGVSEFKSRFLAWYLFGAYRKEVPQGWEAPDYYAQIINEGVDLEQCYWHFEKTRGLTNKRRMREYPTTDDEAFLLGGDPFFSQDALIHYASLVKAPMKNSEFVGALDV